MAAVALASAAANLPLVKAVASASALAKPPLVKAFALALASACKQHQHAAVWV